MALWENRDVGIKVPSSNLVGRAFFCLVFFLLFLLLSFFLTQIS